MKTLTKPQLMSIQELSLIIGEIATCTAGYPKLGTIVVKCIQDFNCDDMYSAKGDDIVNNPYNYIKIVDSGIFGALTSHYISNNWRKL